MTSATNLSVATFSRRAAFSLALTLLLSVSVQPVSAQSKVSAKVSDVFDLSSEEIVLHGKPGAPLFGATDPLIEKERIYVADYLGHRVLMFDARGQLLTEIGSKGTGPNEFQMPYGVVAGQNGDILVNDRGNGRVQAFDANLHLTKSFHISGQNEQLIVVPGKSPMQLLMQGVAQCSNRAGCLLSRLDTRDGRVDSYGDIDTSATVYTWKAAVGDDGQIYIANSVGTAITVYNADGRVVRQWPMRSTSVVAFKPAASATSAQLASVVLRLRHERHTVVKRLTTFGNNVFVQFEVVNPEPGEVTQLLDIYDVSGCPRFQSIATPGLLTRNGGTLFFFDRKKDPLGSVSVRPVRTKFPATAPCTSHPVTGQ